MSQLGESGFWKLEKLYFSSDKQRRTVFSTREENIVQNSPLNCTEDNEGRGYQKHKVQTVIVRPVHMDWICKNAFVLLEARLK